MSRLQGRVCSYCLMNKSSMDYCFKEIDILVRHGAITSVDHPHYLLRDGLSDEFSQSCEDLPHHFHEPIRWIRGTHRATGLPHLPHQTTPLTVVPSLFPSSRSSFSFPQFRIFVNSSQ